MSLTQCNTDENVMQMFLSHLAKTFTKEFGSTWRDNTTFVMDGASYHRSAETRKCIGHLKMMVVLSAPYSYASAPVELWFSHFKRGFFNAENMTDRKKVSRSNASNLCVVLSRMLLSLFSNTHLGIERDRVILLFRHAILHLFKYLTFEAL